VSLCCTLREIDRIEDLQRLRPAWSELWERCSDATPFHSPEWLLPWWSRLFGGGEMWTLALWAGERLEGLAPMFLFGQRGEPRTLVSIGSGVTDYLGFLRAPGAAPEPLWRRIGARPERWDICDLQEIPPGAPMLAGPFPAGWTVTKAQSAVCPLLSLPLTMTELEARLSPKFRHTVHNARNWMLRHGGFESASPEQDSEYMEALFRLHTSRWRCRNEPGMLSSEALRAFFRDVCAGFRRRGWLRLHGVRMSGELRAVVCVFVAKGRAYYYLGGFDESLARHSPGTALIHFALERAVAEGAPSFDFLRKPEAYKYRWGAVDRVNCRLLLRNPPSGVRLAA
jgi:CelD/BcsL family acetyltransferase involved in cellulose biosynthesis